MIKADQPTIFKAKAIVALSSVQDGNMKHGLIESDTVVYENRRKLLSAHMIAMQSTILCKVSYDRTDFTQFRVVESKDRSNGMQPGTDVAVADGIATEEKACALFLPLADCIGAVLFDSARQGRLMIVHLGRHSTEQHGAKKAVEFMQDKFGSKPSDILVWLSPSPSGTEYPLWKRDNKSLREANTEDLLAAGITPEHIEASGVDTVMDTNYFSHSEFLKGHRDTDGRYAIVAKMR